jgi:hypothetical protein
VRPRSSLGSPLDGAALVRLPARSRAWPATLPRVPAGRVLTVTVGHPDLVPVPADDLQAQGYRIVGVADDSATIGHVVDVLVPAAVREHAPDWWAGLRALAERVFDLRMGPVRMVLARELDQHLRAAG